MYIYIYIIRYNYTLLQGIPKASAGETSCLQHGLEGPEVSSVDSGGRDGGTSWASLAAVKRCEEKGSEQNKVWQF